MHTPAAHRWRPIVHRARRSGISIGEFARQNSLNPNTLAWWNWRLGPGDLAPESTFVEVEVAPAVAPALLIRVGAALVEIDAETDLHLLRRVVDALA